MSRNRFVPRLVQALAPAALVLLTTPLAAVAAGPAIAPPGECAVARPHVAIYTTPGQRSKVSVVDTQKSDLGDVLGRSADRFNPDEVAANDTFSRPPPSSPEPPQSCPSPPCVPVGPGPLAGGGGGSPVMPGVVESPPVNRPPPGLPIRPRP